MIFQHTWEKVLSGDKTQTRRLVSDSDYTEIGVSIDCDEYYIIDPNPNTVFADRGYYYSSIRYGVNKTYAVQPGRGKKSIGRIRITSIRREDVREVSEEDAIAEGFSDGCMDFWNTWMNMHDPTAMKQLAGIFIPHPHIYEDDKEPEDYYKLVMSKRPSHLYDAWVLTFELVKE